jgi:hypothetical protein
LIRRALVAGGKVEHVSAAALARLLLGTRGQIIGTGSPVCGTAACGAIFHGK